MKREYSLEGGEIFYVEAFRNFDFLRRFGYVLESFQSHGVENHVVFTNVNINRSVRIVLESYIWVNIERKKSFGFKRSSVIVDVTLLFEYFEAHHLLDQQLQIGTEFGYLKIEHIGKILKSYAEFIQSHLFPVIIGAKWIDEIVDIRKLSNLKWRG